MALTGPVHFYHLYADGDWRTPAEEHFGVLREASFTGDLRVGLVGSAARRQEAEQWLRGRAKVCAEADAGYEQVTLRALHTWAKSADPECPVFYAHSKGAGFSGSDAGVQSWRHGMLWCNGRRWEERIRSLTEGADAAGCHWITPDTPAVGIPHHEVRSSFFAGNYWWARAGYLARLPVPGQDDDRFAAEAWLGVGVPRVCDTAAGPTLWIGALQKFTLDCWPQCYRKEQ